MNQQMAKFKNFIGKKSEYRQNYLPFDYYDFMITAKENENLRFRNKIRDYLHTPFDWDEDQDFYLEIESRFKRASQATQTTERPRHGPNKQNPLHDNYKDRKDDNHHHHHHHQHQHHHKQQHHSEHEQEKQHQQQQQIQSFSHDELKEKQKNKKHIEETRRKISNEIHNNNNNNNNNNSNNNTNGRLVKSASVQINIDGNKDKRPKSVKKRNKNKNNAKLNNIDLNSSSATNSKKVDFRSISSMAVQTPLAWNLRDYNIAKNRSRTAKSMVRSASVAVLQPRRPPFANYGWATRTKDLSIKPTHNALANKVLANHHDRDAILELTLHKLKKDATLIANEYSAVESEAAEHFHTGRSDSRAWNSEYDDKYPDYSNSALRKELYFSQNPNRLAKSTLVLSNPQLRRGPKSAKAKIFYNEH